MKIRRKWSLIATMHIPFGMLAFASYINPESQLWMYTLFSYLGFILGLIIMDSAWTAEKEAGKYL